jgi:hypothetical protein
MPVVVDVGLLEVFPVRLRVGLVAVGDSGVVVLVLVTGELVLPVLPVPEVVRHVQVLVVMDGGLVPMLFHWACLLVEPDGVTRGSGGGFPGPP